MLFIISVLNCTCRTLPGLVLWLTLAFYLLPSSNYNANIFRDALDKFVIPEFLIKTEININYSFVCCPSVAFYHNNIEVQMTTEKLKFLKV